MPERPGPGAGAIRRRIDLRHAAGSAAARIRRLAVSPKSGGEQRGDELEVAGDEAHHPDGVEAAATAKEATEPRFQWRCHAGAPFQLMLICTGDSLPAEREFASECWKDFSCQCMKEQWC